MARSAETSEPPVRNGHLAQVINILRAGPASRTEIARATGISRTTVSAVVAELRAGGLVGEQNAATAPTDRGGRPPVRVALEPLAGIAVGVDFDHDHVKVAVADLTHRVLATRDRDFDVDADGAPALDVAAGLVRDALAETGVPDDHVVGVGMSLPAPVEPSTGVVQERNIMPGWESLKPLEEMRARLGLTVVADNDANLGALAEATLGAGRGCSDFCFVQVRSGIGVGLFLDGHVYRGRMGLAGEFGHVAVVDDGPLCGCGNRGCLQKVASPPAILQSLQAAGRPQRSIEDVIKAARSGDRPCLRVLEDAGRHIGRALAAICNLLNPERVILGGELRLAGSLLLAPIQEELERRALASVAASVQVVPCELGADAEVLGALAQVLLSTDDHLVMRLATSASK